jgi:hypothetical protein
MNFMKNYSLKKVVEILQGGLSSSGLSVAGRISRVTLNDTTWTALPLSALANRNGVGIQNDSTTQIKLNFDNAEPGYIGWSLNASGETFIDVTDAITVYAKSQTGTPTITVMEVS